ncbi:ras-responsive element-binding protein 1-like isoform X2 [Conger conger]|uniref:ras-responsive element-binding protein 1-like isoform X2 n=1 Tax=Conger conger TaxID=82655 RepID=UPI002A5AB597|nr:ras-responsive element-binding protein 1-like isoform X2 [Conger conger]
MSRRKQPNPNKVKLMEGATEDKRLGEGISGALSMDLEHSREKENLTSAQTHEEHTESGETEEDGACAEEGGDGVDLSSINAMMSNVMSASQLNGGRDSASVSPAKTPAKSPSVNRAGRKSQEPKEDRSFICPLCDKNCGTQHQLTMHIRQHNTDSGGTDHSCSICGKALSSASSLDRHMLVHSGERPYKCSVCGQTFTTNGNMHRHMKIHDKDPSTIIASNPPSPLKRRRPSAKRKSSLEDDGDQAEEPPAKKASDDSPRDKKNTVQGAEELHCPICFKTFICKYGLESHMETHPDASLRCDQCCLTFRTHRGLLRHNAVIHKLLPTDPSGRPFIQNNPSIPLGFNDLAFIDFSCHKFPQIAQAWCETNLRRSTSKFHRFVCETCNKAFPLQSALDLHEATHSPEDESEENTTPIPQQGTPPGSDKASFMETMGLQHISQVKPVPTEEETHQAVLDSIRVIHVDPAASSLPQEGLSLPLLDPTSLQGLSQNAAFNFLSLQPFIMQPDSGMVVKPFCSEAGLELADIQQILKMAASAPSQITLPPLSKAPSNPTQSSCKQMPPLKPKPLVAPRTNMAASTPPPLMSAQQASPCCISPNLPLPPSQLLKSPGESSSSSSSSSLGSVEKSRMEADGMLDTLMPMGTGERKIKQEAGEEKDLEGKKADSPGQYPCRFCDQVFDYSGVLQAHMRYHLRLSPYQCNICDYVAPDKATLIRHLRTHSGERPYVCRVCHYPFTVKANCERHLRKKHMKNTRKEIEKNIEYVTTTAGGVGAPTLDPLDSASAGDTTCRYCGEDLKSYRALQIHLRTHNGCQRKPFECRQCGAAFLAKRNCIHHLLKQHPEVQEGEIEEHIATLLPVVASQAKPPTQNGQVSTAASRTVKVEDMSFYARDTDQPLDFSKKGQAAAGNTGVSSGIKLEGLYSAQLYQYESSMEPIDLSMPKNPEKRLKREAAATEVRNEQASPSSDIPHPQEEKPCLSAAYQLSHPVASSVNGVSQNAGRPMKLKPLLPKPTSASSKELPPLASIAQIISSVSAAPSLLKREGVSSAPCLTPEKGRTIKGLHADLESSRGEQRLADASSPGTSSDSLSPEDSKSRGKKRQQSKKKPINFAELDTGSGIDLESSGEFASVEKMLATTDTNKFSPYLQANTVAPGKAEGERPSTSEDEREGQEEKQSRLQAKGKKNAYSNSLQKMTCPYCPRVFPWASSLQRHMLTHTGQKPFPCPQCDAFFSTKSNCERHLLRKHGVANRSLRHNGILGKAKVEDGSHESAESMSDTDMVTGDAMDLTASESKEATDSQGSFSDGQLETTSSEPPGHQRERESRGAHSGLKTPESNTEENDEDSQSNKSLDLNFARRLIDFKFCEGEQPDQQPAEDSLGLESCLQEEDKHTCTTCGKSFRYAATLTRHQRAHLSDCQTEEGRKETPPSESSLEPHNHEGEVEEEVETEEKKGAAEGEGNCSGADSGSEEEDKDKEEKSEEEGGGAEAKRGDGEGAGGAGNKADKRKKICSVCNKRFWSLQDLTRHMRSHTGKYDCERPYQCQTCERTFTLKHSLVRHQRIHLKPHGAEEGGEGAGGAGGPRAGCSEEEVASSDSGDSTPGSGTPPSVPENEAEAAAGSQASSQVGSQASSQVGSQAGSQVGSQAGSQAGEQAESDSLADESTDSQTQNSPQTQDSSLSMEEPPSEPLGEEPPARNTEPAGDYIQGLLEIHTKPSLDHLLPSGEPPLVGVE